MYPGKHAIERAQQPAFIMAATGVAVTYGEFDARANRFAHLLRDLGLERLDHFSIFMENNERYLEICSAGERSGLYYTCVNSYLTADEVAYIINNSQSKVLVTSRALLPVARDAMSSARIWLPGSLSTARGPTNRSSTSSRRPQRILRHRSRTSGWATRCCTRRAPRDDQREFFALWRMSVRAMHCKLPISSQDCGATEKVSRICRPLRSTTRRRRLQ